jgi:hypothetical protein
MAFELELPEGLKARGFTEAWVISKNIYVACRGEYLRLELYQDDWQKTLESIQTSFPEWCDKKTSSHFTAYIGTEFEKINSDDDPYEKTTIPYIQQKKLRLMLEQYEHDALNIERAKPWPTIELPIEPLGRIGTCSELRLHCPSYENPTTKPCGNPLGQPYFLSYVNVANNDTLFSDPIMDPVEEPTQIERIVESVKPSIDEYCSYKGIQECVIRKSLMQHIQENTKRICQICYDGRSKVANDARRYIESLPDVQEKVKRYMHKLSGPSLFDSFPPDFTLVDSINSIFSLEDEQTLKNSGVVEVLDVQEVRKGLRTNIMKYTNRPFPNEHELNAYLLTYCNSYGPPYIIQECRIFYLGIDHKKRPKFKIIVHYYEPKGHSHVFNVPNTKSDSVNLIGQMIRNEDSEHAS